MFVPGGYATLYKHFESKLSKISPHQIAAPRGLQIKKCCDNQTESLEPSKMWNDRRRECVQGCVSQLAC